MEGLYERRMTAQYLYNFSASTNRSSPEAEVLSEWLETNGKIIGVECDALSLWRR